MPGLYCLPAWTALPLQSSCVQACANGYSLGLTVHLTYINLEQQPVDGVFVYPLEESEVVSSFEAATGSRASTFQIQNRPRMEECCLDCNASWNQPLRCTNGHLVLDEDLAHSTFIISTGPIGPSETLTVTLSSSQELATLPNGALRVLFPSVLMPFIDTIPESESEARGLCDDRLALCSTSCFGSAGLKSEQSFLVPPKETDVFRGKVYNPFPYEFTFEMLVKGPCLLAGLESPSHALRADANPFASSASTICITLAEQHKCDRNLEIILYPCEPHYPHLIIEEGAMTYHEYETHIRNRRDYARIAKKDNDGERQVSFVQKRFHKDIFHNPVLMLNFCPEMSSVSTDFHTVTREMLFLIDRSSSVSDLCLDGIKDALLVAVKSLPSGTLLNVVGFGSCIKPLFSASKPCNSETLRMASEYIRKLRTDLGGPNLLAALTWILGQPLQRGFPRQLFLLTGSGAGNTGRIIELVRRQAATVRCFTFGLGSGACHRLLQGLAKVSRGRAEFLNPGERLQPKLIKSLKKAIEPAVSDITIDWYVPDTMEALLSPNEIAVLYPGDRLISYCTLYHIASFRDKKPTGREQMCRSLSRGSAGSVFPSQDEAVGQEEAQAQPVGESPDICKALHDISREISLEFSAEESMKSGDPVSGGDIWKRIYQPSYIQEQYVLTHCSVSTDQSQGLFSHSSTSSESTGSRDVPPEGSSLALESNSQQGQKSVSLCNSSTKSAPLPQDKTGAGTKVSVAASSEELVRKKALARAALCGRSFSSPHGELDAHRLRRALEKVSKKRNRSVEGKLDEIGPELQKMPKGIADSSNMLSPANLDWDMLLEPPYLFSPSPAATEPGESEGSSWPPLRCQVVIHALSAGKPVSWEVTVALDSLLLAKDSQEPSQQQEQSKAWDKLLHRLTAGSVIRDNENVAQREAELEHGFSRRFRLKAMQSSKACNTPSIYTSIVPVDSSTQETLPSALEVRSTEGLYGYQQGSRSASRHHRSCSIGLGKRQDSEDLDDIPASTEEIPPSPISVSSTAQEKQNCPPDGVDSSPSPASVGSQKSMENFLGSRFSISRRKGPGLALRPQCLTPESELSPCNSAIHDYLPLMKLQQAAGMFQLTESFAEVVQIPLDRLRRASPYASHRASLSPASSTSPWALIAKSTPKPSENQLSMDGGEEINVGMGKEGAMRSCSLHSQSTCSEVPSAAVWAQADSGRGSETDACDHSPDVSEASISLPEIGLEPEEADLESMSWATAVALAWLEHRSAGFFVEWELLAAKADAWLRLQQLPDGVDVAALKGAARQLFLLLRHWDENIKLNMLCYNPNNM
ncbi:von Willebrand factor A domain-containing protein 5B2 isoform X1 [Anolis carolinensis]|uniref:von Willebrand factor A domain-containing protein 5B2 isoform X1 n=1 Tax=Anolis carolinensis TaxID=28377 RepID=UPI002F2B4CB3